MNGGYSGVIGYVRAGSRSDRWHLARNFYGFTFCNRGFDRPIWAPEPSKFALILPIPDDHPLCAQCVAAVERVERAS